MAVTLPRCGRLLALGLLTLPTLTASASYLPAKFEDRVCGNEAIVFGEVSDIEKRTMSVTLHGAHGYTTWYDWAKLKEARVLKGGDTVAATYGNKTTVQIQMASDSQAGHPFAHMYEHYPAGTKGIWFLNRDPYSGAYFAGPPANPLPASAETEKKIADALRGCKTRR